MAEARNAAAVPTSSMTGSGLTPTVVLSTAAHDDIVMSENSSAAATAAGETSTMEGVENFNPVAAAAAAGERTGAAKEQGEEEEEEEEEEEGEEEQEEAEEEDSNAVAHVENGHAVVEQQQGDDDDDEAESYYITESGSSHSEIETWITSFCSIRGHEYFAEVSEDFIEDDFNLTGLSSLVPYYKEALDMILDFEPDPDDTARLPNMPIIENSAEQLYGLIHARFLLTRAGQTIMAEKYDLQHFGTCPRYYCHQTPVLPIGTSDLPGNDTVKLYCPSCADLYTPQGKEENEVDGAYFGTSFAGLFLKTYTDIAALYGGMRIPPSSELPLERRHPSKEGSVSTRRPMPGSSVAHPITIPSATPIDISTPPITPPPPVSAVVNSLTMSTLPPAPPAAGSAQAPVVVASSSSAADTSTDTVSTTEVDGKWDTYEMHLFGFHISERAKSGPRMRWLRERPKDLTELDPY
ncbi:casein kinase II regulatory subunit-domain-containing protein [Limtongia smithiae]|uniref:casein kinase II regulatory subunit-domain-containing protein n=1 Tax=Limtongia smithiae TaxID=1125753 RepID=UPI0034CD70C0